MAKAAGPALFVAAVPLGYLPATSRPPTLVNDVIRIPPPVLLLRGGPRP